MIVGKGENCCGCTACEKICPKQAITMIENKKGFLEPKIDTDKCVACNLCEDVCPLKDKKNTYTPFQQYYLAAKRKNDLLRGKSQSGGAFAALAEYVLQQKGIVYGVALDNKLEANYERIDRRKDLNRLLGSKYVQAKINDVYNQVRDDLSEGKQVLFSGTPCHVSGLRKYLQKRKINTSKLIAVDLVCHGVPSPKVYREYKKLLSQKHGNQKINNFNFRDKKFGWHGHVVVVVVGKKKFVNNDFVKFFYSHLGLRDCCYSCKFASIMRSGDITIGDCWGIEKFASDFDDNKGISLIMINSPKGELVWESIKNEFEYISAKQEQVLQPNLQHPTEKPENVDSFWEDYQKYGCEYGLIRYCGCNPKQEYEIIDRKQYLRRLIRKISSVYHSVFVTD